jgi:hypothetical protein
MAKNPWLWVLVGVAVLAVWHQRCPACQQQWASWRSSRGR